MRQLLFSVVVLLLSGCQLLEETLRQPLIGSSSDKPRQTACEADEDQLLEWLNFEHRYISSTLDDKRKLLVDAEKRQQRTLHALLLSTPGQSPEQLRRALDYLSTLKARPECRASQYIALRARQLQLQLDVLERNQALEQRVEELQRQIDALTDLERQITRQREEH